MRRQKKEEEKDEKIDKNSILMQGSGGSPTSK